MEKRQRRVLFSSLPSRHMSLHFSACRLRPPQPNGRSVSDRVSEEASYPRHCHYLPYAPPLHVLPAIYSTFADIHTDANILSQYTLR